VRVRSVRSWRSGVDIGQNLEKIIKPGECSEHFQRRSLCGQLGGVTAIAETHIACWKFAKDIPVFGAASFHAHEAFEFLQQP
jgi:hypothetical protein